MSTPVDLFDGVHCEFVVDEDETAQRFCGDFDIRYLEGHAEHGCEIGKILKVGRKIGLAVGAEKIGPSRILAAGTTQIRKAGIVDCAERIRK